MEHHPFEPIVFADSKILILGSFPSLKSFEEGFYYAHPRNQFWPLLAEVFEEDVSSIEHKKALCKKHHLALWDSAKSLKREHANSSDGNLKEIEVNDFSRLLEAYPSITTIMFTGKKAETIFKRVYKDLPLKTRLLPSPSPAYAAISFEEKLILYKELLRSS